MKTRAQKLIVVLALLALSTLNLKLSTAHAQGTAFTYQGQLQNNGSPASGTYDLTFTLFATNTGGTAVAGPVTTNGVFIANGVFTVLIDFGSGAFTGGTNWLEIGVQTNGGGSFTTLAPRQELTPTPYAIYAGGANAAGISGTIPAASLGGAYSNAVNFNNGADSFDGTFSGQFFGSSFIGGTFVGDFVGNGSGLTDVWQTGGNSGTTAGVNFVGTTDNQPLELHVNGQRALRLTPDNTTNNSPDIIGGSPVNTVAPGLVGVTISGGGAGIYNGQPATNLALGDFNTIGGGYGNTTGSTNFDVTEATVAGGAFNTASGITAAIGGGARNVAYNNNATIAGGLQNRANYHSFVGSGFENSADGTDGAIGAGDYNDIPTNIPNATIGGGYQNTAGGDYSTIGGGVYNDAVGYFAFIGGGWNNTIQTNSGYAVIAGGLYNGIQSNAGYTFIGGGYENQIVGDFRGFGNSVIVGGYFNSILTNADFSAIGGGLDNDIYGDTNDFGTGVIAGGDANTINSNSWNSFIGGGEANAVGAGSHHSFVGGGQNNAANAQWTVIGGGFDNTIQTNATDSTIAGGNGNVIQPNAAGDSIGGGSFNQAGGSGAVVPGGFGNVATGIQSFAAGTQAQATNNGSFVLADDEPTNFYSTASNQLSARFTGGVRFVTAGAGMTLDGQPILSSGSLAPASGSANYIQNQSAGPQTASFNISGNATIGGTIAANALTITNSFRVVGAGNATATPAFIVVSASTNIVYSNAVRVNNPLCNGKSNAILLVTHNTTAQSSFAYNDHPIGLWYDGSYWEILNEDVAAMPTNIAFNVLVINP